MELYLSNSIFAFLWGLFYGRAEFVKPFRIFHQNCRNKLLRARGRIDWRSLHAPANVFAASGESACARAGFGARHGRFAPPRSSARSNRQQLVGAPNRPERDRHSSAQDRRKHVAQSRTWHAALKRKQALQTCSRRPWRRFLIDFAAIVPMCSTGVAVARACPPSVPPQRVRRNLPLSDA